MRMYSFRIFVFLFGVSVCSLNGMQQEHKQYVMARCLGKESSRHTVVATRRIQRDAPVLYYDMAQHNFEIQDLKSWLWENEYLNVSFYGNAFTLIRPLYIVLDCSARCDLFVVAQISPIRFANPEYVFVVHEGEAIEFIS